LTPPDSSERLDADQIIDAALQTFYLIDGWLECDVRVHWSDHRSALPMVCDVA
jgi:hypothetical protein